MKRLVLAAVFFAVLGLYLFTQHPTVSPYRDSGDLAVAAATLGIAHPPGYPLYVLSGKIVSVLLPWSNPAYRINTFSAVSSAASLLVLGAALFALSEGTVAVIFSLC